MIDVYAAADLFPADADRELAAELTGALLRAEGVINPGPTHTNNTAAYIHLLPPSAVNTGGARQRAHRSRPSPDASRRAECEGQKQLVADVTQIVARIAGDPSQAGRTWVLQTEAAEGGWGNCRHGVWARGVRGARRQEEIGADRSPSKSSVPTKGWQGDQGNRSRAAAVRRCLADH
jgi:phenylpyruvate tautomerase PptA (4-oxalocrotonate tautomerase family)